MLEGIAILQAAQRTARLVDAANGRRHPRRRPRPRT
jgi:hypothetical protein